LSLSDQFKQSVQDQHSVQLTPSLNDEFKQTVQDQHSVQFKPSPNDEFRCQVNLATTSNAHWFPVPGLPV
jgi:hypothetical protein